MNIQSALADNKPMNVLWRGKHPVLLKGYSAYLPDYHRSGCDNVVTGDILVNDKSRTANGLTKLKIGFKMGISAHTVDFHVRNILKKMGARNTVAALAEAIKKGLIAL